MDNYLACVIKNSGEIDYIGRIDEYLHHDKPMYNYIKDNYKEVLNYELNDTTRFEIFAYYLTEKGNIVFLNDTTRDIEVKNPIKTGVFLLPKEINEELKESLDKFIDEIEGYDVFIYSDMSLADNKILVPGTFESIKNINKNSFSNFINTNIVKRK